MNDEALERANEERLSRQLSWNAMARASGRNVTGEAIRKCIAGITRLTPEMRATIAAALDWPDDWPDNPPPPREVILRDDQVMQVLASIQQQLTDLAARVEQLAQRDDPPSAVKPRSR